MIIADEDVNPDEIIQSATESMIECWDECTDECATDLTTKALKAINAIVEAFGTCGDRALNIACCQFDIREGQRVAAARRSQPPVVQ